MIKRAEERHEICSEIDIESVSKQAIPSSSNVATTASSLLCSLALRDRVR